MVVSGEIELVWFSTENKLLNLTVRDHLWIYDVSQRTVLYPWCSLANGTCSIREAVLSDQARVC